LQAAVHEEDEEEEEEDDEEEDEDDDDDVILLDEEEEEAALAIPPLGTYLGPTASSSPRARAAGAEDLPPAGAGADDDGIIIYSWGQAAYHELGHGDNVERHAPTPIEYCRGKQIVAACAGNEHTALLSQDGTVHVCGYNDSGQVCVRAGRQ
jgi:hypothetical protein